MIWFSAPSGLPLAHYGIGLMSSRNEVPEVRADPQLSPSGDREKESRPSPPSTIHWDAVSSAIKGPRAIRLLAEQADN